jgi:carboxyl-terminal processing protease
MAADILRLRTLCITAVGVALAGCGGGGAGGGGGSPAGVTGSSSAIFAQQCDPANPLAPTKVGSLSTEKQWLRAYMDEAYLWYREIPAVDANAAAFTLPASTVDGRGVPQSLSNYLQALKTPATTASGARRDQFSFTYSSSEWQKLSQSGVTFGYGIEWAAITSAPPRKFVVAYTEPGSPAGTAGVLRGAELIAVDGNDFVSGNNVAALNAGLFPKVSGETHSFTLRDVGAATTRTVTLTSGDVAKVPVQNVKTLATANGTIGYLTFNDHIATSEAQLIAAVNQLKAANIQDLVLDVRYNGGGYLYIASALSYMIAGPTPTAGKPFETLRHNDKRSGENRASAFETQSCNLGSDFRCSNRQALPTLNLRKVYILTSGDTCSASESIINGLRGVDVQVHLIGSKTCGKPYGFVAKDNCGVSYFPIEFQGVNAKDFGDYADGFIPGTGALPTNVPGCAAADDYSKALGDPAEGMLSAALRYRASGDTSCPAAALPKAANKLGGYQLDMPAVLMRPPVRENRMDLPQQ